MAIFDFTPMYLLLGNEVCFIDKQLEALMSNHYEHNQFHYVYGRVTGFCCDLTQDGNLIFFIFVNDSYYALSAISVLLIA
jgi:hypothetical protein